MPLGEEGLTVTITIYKIWQFEGLTLGETGARFALTPWGSNTRELKGEDDGGNEYILPDGFYVGYIDTDSPCPTPVICDADGDIWHLVGRDVPTLCGDRLITLRRSQA